VGLYWVPGQAGVQDNKIADRLTRDGSVQKFVGSEPSLGGLYAQYKKENKTQRQAQKPISGPSPTIKTRLLSLNKTKSRAVISFITRHNTLEDISI
jgi:hypothetical protein